MQVRIGIHTGLVVVGEMGAGDTREPMAIVGETPNLAARLQEIAKPNTIVLSAATHQLIEGYFLSQPLGAQSLKGVTTPVELYQILGEGLANNRLEAAETRGLTPFVGREQELGLFQERWEQAQEGHGQVVLLTGEAGKGFNFHWRGESCCEAGCWLNRDRERKGLYNCARGWSPTGPQGQSYGSRISLPCWQRRMGK